MTVTFRGRCSVWRRWAVTAAATRVVNDVSCVTRIHHGNSVLQSISKYHSYSTVLLCTTKCYKALLRTEKSYMKCH